MKVFLFLFFLSSSMRLYSEIDDFFFCKQFLEDQILEQVILIFDVDGVVRESIEAVADPRVIQAVKSLLRNKEVNVTFISGTPIENNLALEPWRRGNVPLTTVFGSTFAEELLEKRVTIYGVLGGHQMKEDGSLEVVDEYTPEISWELSKLLIHAFLHEVLEHGSLEQKAVASDLQLTLDSLVPTALDSSRETPIEFHQIIDPIREFLDPNFRLVCNGALIETHTSHPMWNTELSFQWIKEQLNHPQHLISALPLPQKQMATGFAKKGEEGFNYLLICKTNKGVTTKELIQEKLKQFPNALVITVGDTQVDFPMHQNAHIAFHVGLQQAWQNYQLSNCIMIQSDRGEDSQHVEGTLKILRHLEMSMGKPFCEFKNAISSSL